MSQTINESLEQIKAFQDKVTNLKNLIRVHSNFIINADNTSISKELYKKHVDAAFEDLKEHCNELDKFTQKK